MPLKSDPLHHISMALTCQNDLKKNLGVSTLKLTDTYAINSWVKMKNELSQQPDGISHNLKFNFSVMKEKALIEVTNTTAYNNGTWDFFNPGVSLLSKQLSPYTLQAGLQATGDLSFGITKDIPEDGRLGWQINVGMNGTESYNISPTLNYKVNSKISASVGTTI
jgi:hypothetical protein